MGFDSFGIAAAAAVGDGFVVAEQATVVLAAVEAVAGQSKPLTAGR